MNLDKQTEAVAELYEIGKHPVTSYEITEAHIASNVATGPYSEAERFSGGEVGAAWTGAVTLALLAGDVSPTVAARLARTAGEMLFTVAKRIQKGNN